MGIFYKQICRIGKNENIYNLQTILLRSIHSHTTGKGCKKKQQAQKCANNKISKCRHEVILAILTIFRIMYKKVFK